MNRINRLFTSGANKILSVYFTAGYPGRDSTTEIIQSLAEAGADMIEIGMPFSDPMADGPIIQQSGDRALKNGMSLKLLFAQLRDIRKKVDIPLLLMGYLNPVLQFGIDNFCRHCADTGIDGVILPDLPLEVYNEEFQKQFESSGLHNILLISPQTSIERIKKIDAASRAFVYMVSASSTTGVKGTFSQEQITYFERINAMDLSNPTLIGFGISDHESFIAACRYATGAIIGSAFVKMLSQSKDLKEDIRRFVNRIRGK